MATASGGGGVQIIPLGGGGGRAQTEKIIFQGSLGVLTPVHESISGIFAIWVKNMLKIVANC